MIWPWLTKMPTWYLKVVFVIASHNDPAPVLNSRTKQESNFSYVVEAVDDINIWKSLTFSGQCCKCTRAPSGLQICKLCTGGVFLTQAGKRAGALNSLICCVFDIFCAPIYISPQFEAQRYWSLWQRGWRIMSYIKKENISIGLKHQVRSLSMSKVCPCITRSCKMYVAPIFEHSF